MGKTVYLSAIIASALSIAALGCKSTTTNNPADAGGGSNTGDSGGGTMGDSGGGGGALTMEQQDKLAQPDKPNDACPQAVGPTGDDPHSPKGACCYRTSNKARVKAAGDGDLVEIEYRLNYSQTINHPMGISLPVVISLNTTVSQNEQQSHLMRFKGPRKGGKVVAGPGKIKIGMGAYNCGKGTYSFYSDKAAPVRDLALDKDPKRWQSHEIDSVIDPTMKTPNYDKAIWKTNVNRDYAYSPYISMSDYTLDWELLTQGFTIEEMPTDDSTLDCIGELKSDMTGWTPGGKFITFANMEDNDHDGIDSLNNMSMCQLMSFGAGVSDPTAKDVQCSTTPRCMPGSAKCTWVKLPESLCPTTADEKSKWGCHVGAENNPDKEPTKCTATAPTTTLDPDMGATTEGQCCDPLGKSTTLPKCNAFLLRNEFAAAAAQITDVDTDTLQQNCVGK